VLSHSQSTSAQPSNAPVPEVRLEAGRFVVAGRSFLVKGIHYGPWRPGTGPNKGHSYPRLAGIAQDFEAIHRANANTVLLYEAPEAVIDLAHQHGLRVVYCFALDWWAVGDTVRHAAVRSHVVERVQALRSKPAMLAWMLGNEVGGDVLQVRGEGPVVEGLSDLYAAIKRVDSVHPVSHANWPPARRLDLRFLDFASFNVYPLWPPEVVALGFGRYIETVLRPIAGERPLLISEFGANTIEAGADGQARLLRESWRGLLQAGAAGGIVFEFADEWWKNYNNPARPGDWWTRRPAPDDELRHDADPEETYGLVLADRTPRPALSVVTEMFGAAEERETARTIGATALSGLLLTAVVAWAAARQRQAGRDRQRGSAATERHDA
jgi:hypothetical protein